VLRNSTRLFQDPCGGLWRATELHCRLQIRGRTRFRQSDVAVVLGLDDSTESRYLDRAPDLVVEIRSPQDTVAAQLRKIDEYLQNGAKLAWLILPEERSVIIVEPGKQARTAVAGEVLDGANLLPDLRIPVDELFV
jgi:Uma2 family endonuclease